MRILIAEDHNATRLILEAAVRSLGHDCVSAGDTHCAVMCDFDGFKAYNDSNGHLAGDDVLRAVARTLKARVGTATRYIAAAARSFWSFCPNNRSTAD
jgi:diguanylate cyclase (GGDEF)-like protein